MKLELSRHIFEKFSVRNFMKIRPVEAELLMRTDRQADKRADVTKLIFAFHNSVKTPKSGPSFCCVLYVLVLVLYEKTV
jgi:hypothetical protein